MKNQIVTDTERAVIDKFLTMKCPPIYKTDNTDRILFVETVEFDICQYLLGKRKIGNEQYSYIMNEYERFLTQTNSSAFDKYTNEHFKLIVKLVDIFKKYYSSEVSFCGDKDV